MVDISSAENPRDYGLTEEQAHRISLRYQFSPAQFRQQEEQLQQRILRRIQFGDLPRQRAEFAAQFLRGDDNEIAPDGYSKAADRLSEMRALQLDRSRGRVAGMGVGQRLMGVPFILEEDAGLAPDNTGWKALGPGNVGGRIRSILIVPAKPPSTSQTIYIGSVSGGVWITTDGGATWQPGDDLMANLAVCSMAMVSNASTTTIYAGTGEGFNGVTPGNGIFKTTDGWTWQQMDSTKVKDTNLDFRWVNALAANRDGSVLLAGTATGIFRSTDSGMTWSKRQPAVVVGNILFDPTNDTKCVAGMLNGGGICYSTDSGSTWQQATKPTSSPPAQIGRIQVCYAAKDSSVVYASVEITGPTAGSQIWRSANGGQSFTKKGSTTNYLAGQGDYDNIIWAGDPMDSTFVIVGGQDLYKSPDSGDTLSKISAWQRAPNSAHADHHVIVADPGYDGTSNKTVYFGNDGGLYKTTDVKTVGTNPDQTNGWTSLNAKLPITQCYSLAGKFSTDRGVTTIASIVGGTQDNGTLKYTPAGGPNAWTAWSGGDGGYVASDPASSSNYYGEHTYLQVFRSTPTAAYEDIFGQYWNGSAWVWKLGTLTLTDARNGTAPFIAPLMLAPGNSNVLYAGGASLWRTLNPQQANSPTAGPNWSAVKAPVTGAMVSAIGVAAGATSAGRVMVGYSNGAIYKTSDISNPNAWYRTDPGIGANRMCTSLLVDKDNDNKFFATFGGFQTGNIWTTTDSGAHWTNIGAALPPAPIYCVAIHPTKSQWLYIGTETGIFASEDSGQNWTPVNEGPTNCRVYQFAWMGNTLCCASHGRGMFSIDLTVRQQASLVLTGDDTGALTASDAGTGALVSSYVMPSSQVTAAPLVDGSAVYCGYAQSPIVAKFGDVRNLSAPQAWKVTFQDGIAVNATPCLVKGLYPGDADVLYVVAADGVLHALNAATGGSLWALQVVPSGDVGAGVHVYSNQIMNQWIYVATDKGMYAVNTQTRSLGWSKSYVCSAAPLLAANTVFVPTQDGTLYSLQARSGVGNWQYDTGRHNVSTPVWILGSVIVGNQYGGVIGLDYNAGTDQFFESFAEAEIDAITADGKQFYFAATSAQSNSLYAYQLNISASAPRTVSQLWAVTLPSRVESAPQVIGPTLYLTTANSKLRAFVTTGSPLWEQSLSGVALSGPDLVYS